MTYDHIVPLDKQLDEEPFHLACGYHRTTSFLFEKANFAVVIDCCGSFTFYTADGDLIETRKAKPMDDGRERYMDILITTTDSGVVFQLPEYAWIDHYPHCDGESDRWDAIIIGIRDEIRYPDEK